jgi:Zn-dependent protease with chaperone function
LPGAAAPVSTEPASGGRDRSRPSRGGAPRGGSSGGSPPGGARSSSSRRRRGRGSAGRSGGTTQGASQARRPSGRSGQRPAGPPRSPSRSAAELAAADAAWAEATAAIRVTTADTRANRRRAWSLCIAAGVVPGAVVGAVLGLVVSLVAGAAAGAGVLVLVAATVWRAATPVALRVLRARPLPEEEAPGLYNTVEGLCPTFGVRQPRLMVVDDAVPNACALGRRADAAVLVVTTGLLDRLGPIELEGVIGHELTHVKRHDTVVSAVAVTVVGPWSFLLGSDRLLHAAVGRGRELRADAVAVAAVRYPPGLHDALETLVSTEAAGRDSLFAGRRYLMTRWLWVDPTVGRRLQVDDGDLDGTAVRIAALAEW